MMLLRIEGEIINPNNITKVFRSPNGDLEIWYTGGATSFFTGREAEIVWGHLKRDAIDLVKTYEDRTV